MMRLARKTTELGGQVCSFCRRGEYECLKMIRGIQRAGHKTAIICDLCLLRCKDLLVVCPKGGVIRFTPGRKR